MQSKFGHSLSFLFHGGNYGWTADISSLSPWPDILLIPQIRLDHQISNSASVFGRISCPTLVHMQESGMELHVSEEVGMDESEEQELAIRNIELLND